MLLQSYNYKKIERITILILFYIIFISFAILELPSMGFDRNKQSVQQDHNSCVYLTMPCQMPVGRMIFDQDTRNHLKVDFHRINESLGNKISMKKYVFHSPNLIE